MKKIFLDDKSDYLLNSVEEISNNLENIFDLDILKRYNLSNIKENFFKKDIGSDININININDITEINEIENGILENKLKIENIVKELTTEETKETKEWIKVMQTEKEGYYLFTSKVRFEKLIKDKNLFSTVKLSNGIKFYNNDIKKWSNAIINMTEKLSEKIKNCYLNFLEIFTEKYEKVITDIIEFLSDFDVCYSNSLTASKYNFIKPEIIANEEESFIEAENLRHILIELYNQEELFTANDVKLNNNSLGYLILAPNNCGKSSYLRTIGYSLVLAQMGGYVPAKKFKFNPFNKILCKISSIDNIYENKSKFISEIIEMDNILKIADVKTLVLIDEFLSGTEIESAAALTVASIDYLTNKKCKFIYTTHITSIIEIIDSSSNKQILLKHFDYDIKDGKIIFDRKLKDGAPKKMLYGIEIASIIIEDKLLLENAIILRNKLLNKSNNLLNPKLSNYNKNKIMNECEICGNKNNLETHHKIEQQTANEYGIIVTETNIFHKNSKQNLQILCNLCHKKTHYNK